MPYILRSQCSHKFVNKFNKPNTVQIGKSGSRSGKFLDTYLSYGCKYLFCAKLTTKQMKIFPL